MIETTPKVFLISRPAIDWDQVDMYLKSIDGLEWSNRVQDQWDSPDGEVLTEFAGRLCYRSWKPGLNANVVKVREDSVLYLENILKSKHGSVLEHAQYSFVFQDVSRVFTHELVRHRAGVAISQESLRFVRLTDIGFRIPPILEPIKDQVISVVEALEDVQRAGAKKFGLDDEGVPFHYKKEVTSALRRLAPIGLSTSMLWSANIRTLRWLIEARTTLGAEEEIHIVFNKVGHIMQQELPNLFGDFKINKEGSWIPLYSKV